MSHGWIAAIVGFAVFGLAARNVFSATPDSSISTPWYVPQVVEDYANTEAARIQAEQKRAAEARMTQAIAKGALAMAGTALVLGAFVNSGRSRRSR